MDNQAMDLKLGKKRRGYRERGKKESSERELENARKIKSKLFEETGSKDCM